MRKGAITRGAVLRTLAEHDRMGRESFLAAYGYGPARAYVLVHEGREYDSKAVAGVAHKYDQGRPLASGEFSGGREHAAAWLTRLGFQVRAMRNPDWSWDELLLTCDLVQKNGWKRLYPEDPRAIELSQLLQLLPIHDESVRTETFRNPNGVGRKSVDLATRHPDHRGRRTNGSALDLEVVQAFLARPGEMSKAAALIREGVASGELQALPPSPDEDLDDYSAPEGRLLLRRYLARERSRSLRTRKIAAVRRQRKELVCEACDFDFARRYGERGEGYIEVHHVVPLHVAGAVRTRLADLALVCANCHRMIHRRSPWLTPEALRALIQRPASGGF